MVQVPSRADLLQLAAAAGQSVPLALFGFVRPLDESRASLLYASGQGVGRCTVPIAGLPAVLLPGSDVGEITAPIDTAADGPVGSLLRLAGARRALSVTMAGTVPATRFWVASTGPDAFTSGQRAEVRAAALSAAGMFAEAASGDAQPTRLERLEAIADLQASLLRVLDGQGVFEAVSAAAQRSLPHDFLALRLFDEGPAGPRTFTGSAAAAPLVGALGHGYAQPLTPVLDFDIVDDYRAHPLGTNEAMATMGVRSSLRLAMRFDGTVIGDLTFVAVEPCRFSNADVAIGRRLADHAAAALAHHRLALEGRRATALQERATNLEVLDGLLATLTGVLDVREVFDRVSAIAQKVLPHDAMSISELVEEGAKVRIHASYGLGRLQEPFDMVMPDPSMVREPWDYRLLEDVHDYPEYAKGPGWAAGMRAMLFVSIRMEGHNWGGLNFYSKTVGHFVKDDVLVARRITDHVALALSHRRLADEARRSEELRARTTSLELLDDLLVALTDSGDIRTVLSTISGVVRRVLPHDGAALLIRLPDGTQARVYATSGFPARVPDSMPVPDRLLASAEWELDLVEDVARVDGPVYGWLSSQGFRALIRVPIQMDGRSTGALALLSNTAGAFKASDVLIVRRVADRLTVTLARDREIAASARADEATARAARLEARVKTLTDELDARTGYRRVVGESMPWRQVLTQAAQVAATETTVLLLGESGTGKEVVARFLHRGSPRSSGPFVGVNCAALPEQLLEAELFGYERGAYTGATQSKPGQLEQAAGGTLFLDEVAEMSLTAQPKFLRVLQEREFQRLGGTRVLRTDVRIVAATNRDLPRSIANGHFREDLYYRLNVFAIRLPPLRERRDDILPLSEAFLAEFGRGLGRPPGGIARDARQMLLDYAWPGNVRELRNVLERAAILCDGGLITADLLVLNVTPALPPQLPAAAGVAMPQAAARTPPPSGGSAAGAVAGDLATMERDMIERALRSAKFNKSKAAQALGLTRHQLYVRLRRYGLE